LRIQVGLHSADLTLGCGLFADHGGLEVIHLTEVARNLGTQVDAAVVDLNQVVVGAQVDEVVDVVDARDHVVLAVEQCSVDCSESVLISDDFGVYVGVQGVPRVFVVQQ